MVGSCPLMSRPGADAVVLVEPRESAARSVPWGTSDPEALMYPLWTWPSRRATEPVVSLDMSRHKI